MHKTLLERIELHTIKLENGCWETDLYCRGGIPMIYFQPKRGGKGRRMSVPRIIYQHHFGEIDYSQFVLHKCGNKGCINPEHLYTGTLYESMNQ
jgi:hypothetical protein